MLHFGKKPTGELEIIVSGDDVRGVYDALDRSGLLSRRVFDGLKRYLEQEFKGELKGRR